MKKNCVLMILAILLAGCNGSLNELTATSMVQILPKKSEYPTEHDSPFEVSIITAEKIKTLLELSNSQAFWTRFEARLREDGLADEFTSPYFPEKKYSEEDLARLIQEKFGLQLERMSLIVRATVKHSDEDVALKSLSLFIDEWFSFIREDVNAPETLGLDLRIIDRPYIDKN